MLARLLRGLGLFVYAIVLVGSFFGAAYASFNLFVRSGVTTVPEVVGLPETKAVSVLADQGLRLRSGPEAERFDEKHPPGHVMQQDPQPGSLVKRGSAVTVVQSLGPQLVDVPALEGRALPAAQVTISGSGLALGRTLSIHSGGHPAGTVVEQDPPPGAQVQRSTPVDLFLSLDDVAEAYLMPDLVYRDYEEVRGFFETAGFRLGSVKFEPYEGIAPGIVLRQFPLAGHPLRRREVISLVVSTRES